jgi:prepilin-type N-terminal cleavage/methylation domain-containing protein
MRFRYPIPDTRYPRRAFTLVELLVAMAIIVLLVSIVLAFYPKREVRYAAQGADQLQTMVAAAKSRALRDQTPRGIRLISTPGQVGFRQFQYIEVPEPYAPNAVLTVQQTTGTTARIAGDHRSSIFAGDLLEITHGTGSIHRILTVAPNLVLFNGTPHTQMSLASPPPAASNADLSLPNNYRFIRQPRPLMGETSLQLPDKVFVQPMNPTNPNSWPSSRNIPTSWDGANFDIIFSPSGQVINSRGGTIVLVVMDDNNVSKPTLLAIYSTTGACAAHPANDPPPAGQDHYQFTRDGRASGL